MPKESTNNTKYQFNGTVGNVVDKMNAGVINNNFAPNSTNSKLLWTAVVVFCGVGIGYLTNRLPDWKNIQFFGEHLYILIGVCVFSTIQIIVTWKNS